MMQADDTILYGIEESRDSISPVKISFWAEVYLEGGHIDEFIKLYNAVKDDPRLAPAITQEMIKEEANHYLDNSLINEFIKLYNAVKDDTRLAPAITQKMIREEANSYLDNNNYINEFIELYHAVKNDTRLASTITQSFQKIKKQQQKEEDITNIANLFEEAHDKPELLSVLEPDCDILQIPEDRKKAHQWPITFVFNRESGSTEFYSGCKYKESLSAVKQHCDAHPDDQRREKAFPLVVGVLETLKRGETPDDKDSLLNDIDATLHGQDAGNLAQIANDALYSIQPS